MYLQKNIQNHLIPSVRIITVNSGTDWIVFLIPVIIFS